MKRPAATPDHARKALRLVRQNITGEELAHRLKVGIDQAALLATVGALIENAEGRRLTRANRAVLKVVVRVIARNTMMGVNYAKTGDVDFAARKRPGWCATQALALTYLGLVTMPVSGRIELTIAGWAFAWETGLIKQNWTVPA